MKLTCIYRQEAVCIVNDKCCVLFFRCSTCKFTTDNKDLFLAHTTTCQKQKKPVEQSANLTFKYKNETYICENCCQTYYETAQFIEHIVCHTTDSPYICLTCKQNFTSREIIENHSKNDHPKGDAKCGLMGIKRGRKVLEDLVAKKEVQVWGKVNIPVTPRSEGKIAEKQSIESSSGISAPPSNSVPAYADCNFNKDTKSGNSTAENSTQLQKTTETATTEPSTFVKISDVKGHTLVHPSMLKQPTILVIDSEKKSQSCSSESDTSKNVSNAKVLIVTSKGETKESQNKSTPSLEEGSRSGSCSPSLSTCINSSFLKKEKMDPEKEKHLNSLFGQLNKETNQIQPTSVSTKIQKIATVPVSNVTPIRPKNPVKQFHEYTTTTPVNIPRPPVKPVTRTQGQPVLFIPFGPAVSVQQITRPALQQVASIVPSPAIRQQVLYVQNAGISQTAPTICNSGFQQQALAGIRQLVSSVPNTKIQHSSPSELNPVTQQSNLTMPSLGIQQAVSTASNLGIKQSDSVVPNSGINHTGKTLTSSGTKRPALELPTSISSSNALAVNVSTSQVQTKCTTIINKSSFPLNVRFQPPTSNGGAVATAKTKLSTQTTSSSGNTVNETAKEKCGKPRVFVKRPGYGFVCEVCKKFTTDVNVFKKHIWDHLHSVPAACKTCDSNMVKGKLIDMCQMVYSVVYNVQKRAVEDKNVKVLYDGEKEIIEIKDDDTDSDIGGKNKVSSIDPEVVILDDSDPDNGDFPAKIVSSYNLASISGEKEKVSKTSDKTQEMDQVSTGPVVKQSDSNKSSGGDYKGNSHVTGDKITAVPKDLLNDSLGQTDEETESFVSQVLDSTLKDFDPSNDQPKKALESDSTLNSAKNMQFSSANKKTNETNDSTNETIRDFDKEVIQNHGKDAFYLCGYENCGYVCLSSQEYREHLKVEKHKNEYCYMCGHCGQKDYVEDGHVRHMFAHSNIKKFVLCKCPVRFCKYKTNMINLYIEHLKAHQPEELSIKCTYCHRSFPDEKSLASHLKLNLLKFVTCPYCSFKFGNRMIVREHIKLSHPDKSRIISVSSQIVCNEREINFYVTPVVQKVEESSKNTVEKPESPSLDIPTLLKEVQMEPNTKANDNDSDENADSMSLPEVDQAESKGDEVKKTKSSEQAKLIPEVKNANKSKILDFIGPKSLQCPHCSFISYHLAHHAQHVSVHDIEPERHLRFLCTLCPKGQNDLTKIRKHMENHTGTNELKLYSCTICSYITNLKSHIMDHCRDAHQPKSMYTLKVETIQSTESSCKYCAFKTRNPDHLVLHEKLVHKVKADTVAVDFKDGKGTESGVQAGSSEQDELPAKISKKRRYHCEYCKSFFKHKCDLKEHMKSSHKEIENKQFVFFKCKYCSFTSTMKETILSHISKKHTGKQLRILRKIETVDKDENEGEAEVDGSDTSGPAKDGSDDDKEKVEVPDGNIFKPPWQCPKCSFASSLRIDAIRHLKTHPDVKPVRPMKKATARKSTTLKVKIGPNLTPAKLRGSLIQDFPKHLQNPFTVVKESLTGSNSDYKDIAASPSKDSYILGEQLLHTALSACFIQLENDIKFQCRICQQKIAKKFVLHRHILDHLKIVFFRCKYCDEGAIEKTLLIGHIQKEHNFKPLQYVTVSKSELEEQFKERIFSLNFNDTVCLETKRESSVTPTELGLKVKPVTEYKQIDSDSESSKSDAPVENEREKVEKTRKTEKDRDVVKIETKKHNCPKCKYTARATNLLQQHLAAHNDPTKCFCCSVCGFIGERFNVIKHIYRVFHEKQAKCLPMEKKKKESESLPVAVSEDSASSREDTPEVTTETPIKSYEIKTIFKCKICGHKGDSRSALYHHFRKSCNQNFYQCSSCKFQATTKTDIAKHGGIRHVGIKVTSIDLPAVSKMKIIKIPVKLSNKNKHNVKESENVVDEHELSRQTDVADKDKDLKCQICKKYICETLMKLQYHINTAHQGSVLHCQKCPYKTPLIKHMVNHCKNVHLQEEAVYRTTAYDAKGPAGSTLPVTVLESSDSLDQSLNKGIPCPKCSALLVSWHTLKNHLFRHFKYHPYICQVCGYAAIKSSYINYHIRQHHPGKSVKFNYVKNEDVETKIQKLIAKAKKDAAKKKIVSGEARPKYLNKYEIIEEGIRKHKGKFYCDICGTVRNRSTHIRSHIESIHDSVSKKRPLEVDSDTEFPKHKAVKYEAIPESSKQEESVSHPKQAFKYKVRYNAAGMKVYHCTLCDYNTLKSRNLSTHNFRHHSKKKTMHRCWICMYQSNIM